MSGTAKMNFIFAGNLFGIYFYYFGSAAFFGDYFFYKILAISLGVFFSSTGFAGIEAG